MEKNDIIKIGKEVAERILEAGEWPGDHDSTDLEYITNCCADALRAAGFNDFTNGELESAVEECSQILQISTQGD